jgi:hypothetical protein
MYWKVRLFDHYELCLLADKFPVLSGDVLSGSTNIYEQFIWRMKAVKNNSENRLENEILKSSLWVAAYHVRSDIEKAVSMQA